MEAHHLFGTPYERIDVVVHPQSLVHGLIQLADGAMLAHIGPRDMRVAISYALHGGESVEPADRAAGPRERRRADVRGGRPRGVPLPGLARAAAARGGHGAVRAERRQRDRRTRVHGGAPAFNGIPAVIEQTLTALARRPGARLRVALRGRPRSARRRRRGRRRVGVRVVRISRCFQLASDLCPTHYGVSDREGMAHCATHQSCPPTSRRPGMILV